MGNVLISRHIIRIISFRDKKLDLNICKNVEVQVHDKNSAIGTEVQTAISARVVDISMQHKHNVRHQYHQIIIMILCSKSLAKPKSSLTMSLPLLHQLFVQRNLFSVVYTSLSLIPITSPDSLRKAIL